MKRLLILCLILLFPVLACAGDVIEGSYCYTAGDGETMVEAKEKARLHALRRAITGYSVYMDYAATVEDDRLKSELIQAMSNGVARNVRVVEEKVDGRSVCLTVRGTVLPDEVKVLADEVTVKEQQPVVEAVELPEIPGVAKVMTAKEKGDGVKVLVLFPGTDSKRLVTIHCDYYDGDGDLVQSKSTSKWAHHQKPGSVMTLKFDPASTYAASHVRIRLTEQ